MAEAAYENGQGYSGKHSSGDLHSRLKTRKILGVGETDNGDIHRSKISQVLGHNEHLYVRLPRGFWTTHVLMATGASIEAALLLVAPSLAAPLSGQVGEVVDSAPLRLAGAALAGLCIFVWSLLGTSDKHCARTMLLSMVSYHALTVCLGVVSTMSSLEGHQGWLESPGAPWLLLRVVLCGLCLGYFYSIAGFSPIRGTKPTPFRGNNNFQKDN